MTGKLQFPENFGKTWRKTDEKVLYDMINYGCTVLQIAVELKRHPVSVVNTLAKYVDDDSIENRISQYFYDVPVREFIRWL
ncbi:TPA: hypothetical protein U2L64_001034 [Citrobacter koseri]|uniref:hypothetical protein n=1 Tax=Citrobacter koseri TaxID=545 RepID=UPI000DD0C50C|nr:hypothetical protein [Citrobacter koseri]HEM7951813.1 hypothetical protein [Citrobacter koseri]HEM7988116.1 hypothetical protein [Citrobacter koseri]